jgi:acetone carboxylase gamma subunit
MEQHSETIKCPECGKVQRAIVEHSEPWYTYVHDCIGCGYTIMESEWWKMDEPIHVYPTGDLREHYLESVDARLDGFGDEVPPYCPCLCDPKKERQENGTWIIVHNSFDGREGVEIVNDLLKTP